MLYQIIAIVVLIIFYGCHFLKMVKQRQRGIQTNQMGKGKYGFVKLVEITLGIATVIAPLSELAAIALDLSALSTPVRVLGVIISLTGLVIFITAVIQMRDSWRAGVPETDETKLVTNGIFRISRNPAFLGFDLIYIGILLMFFSWWLFAISMFTILMIHLQIVNVEEDFLLKTFGDEYLCYKGKVRRYLGVR